MRVALVHYHFDRGGVTRVVELGLKALQRDYPEIEVACLGGRPFGEFRPRLHAVLPRLNYSIRPGPADGPGLAGEVLAAARSLFGGYSPDLIHWHNPTLGKNVHAAGAILSLAEQGYPLLLHHHDFAEDYRPENFFLRESALAAGETPYPFSSRILHAFINQRDLDILQGAGLPDTSASLVPNPIEVAPIRRDADPRPFNQPFKLYPVRASRRKNLGEFLLRAQLSQMEGQPYHFVTTLGPSNPNFQKTFAHWCGLAGALNLPVKLAVNQNQPAPFSTWMQHAESVVTTSVAEGFGLSFFEPALFGKPVEGRDLPEITGSFRSLGFHWSGLAPTLPVSTHLFDKAAWHARITTHLRDTYHRYGQDFQAGRMRQVVESWTRDDQVDFARLDEKAQTEVLRAIKAGGAPLPRISPALGNNSSSHILLMDKHFHPARHARHLARLYYTLLEGHPEPFDFLSPRRILQIFLNPTRFSPLKT